MLALRVNLSNLYSHVAYNIFRNSWLVHMQTILKIQVRNTTYVIAGIARYRWAFLSFTFTSTNID